MADEVVPQPVEQIRQFLQDRDETGARPENLVAAGETMRKGIDLMSERKVGAKIVSSPDGKAAIILPYISPADQEGDGDITNERVNADADYSARKPWGAVMIAETGEVAFVEPAVTDFDRTAGMKGGIPQTEKVYLASDEQVQAFRRWLAEIKNGTLLATNSPVKETFLDAFKAYVAGAGQRVTESSNQTVSQDRRDKLNYRIENALSTAERRLAWQEQSGQRDDASTEDSERSRNALLLANAARVRAMNERLATLKPQTPPEPAPSQS